jgi:hypothetical protein
VGKEIDRLIEAYFGLWVGGCCLVVNYIAGFELGLVVFGGGKGIVG